MDQSEKLLLPSPPTPPSVSSCSNIPGKSKDGWLSKTFHVFYTQNLFDGVYHVMNVLVNTMSVLTAGTVLS